jgi:hypothetical protein
VTDKAQQPPPMARYEQYIDAASGSAVYAVLEGDMHVRNGRPVYWFERFPLDDTPVSVTSAEWTTTELTAWRDKPSAGVSVTLLHGEASSDTVRLAAVFAANSRSTHWSVWAARHAADLHAAVGAPAEAQSDLLLIVEHADRWLTDELQMLLQDTLLHRPRRTRVLLTALQAGPWWLSIRHRLNKAVIDVGPALQRRLSHQY